MQLANNLTLLRQPEVQLSKKELKQRELDELEAALAEFGLDAAPAESEEHAPEPQSEQPAQEGGDSQASKKKKKKKPRKKAAAASTEGSSTTAAVCCTAGLFVAGCGRVLALSPVHGSQCLRAPPPRPMVS